MWQKDGYIIHQMGGVQTGAMHHVEPRPALQDLASLHTGHLLNKLSYREPHKSSANLASL